MKQWLLCLMLLGAVSFAQASDDRYYVVASKHLKSFFSFKDTKRIQVLKQKQGYALVRLTPEQVMDISVHVHETEHNCGGVIDITVDSEDSKISIFAAFDQFLKDPKLPNYNYEINDTVKVKSAISKLSKETYESDLREFTSFPNRFANSEFGIQAANWLRDKATTYARDLGRPDAVVEMIATPRYSQPSVLVKLPGTNPSLPGVLIGGHMDSYSGNKPAVDDDASGTIASLEVFRGLVSSGLTFERDIYIAFYAAEEWGLHGSKKIANEFVRRGIKLKGIMQLDMISYSAETEHFFTFVRDFTSDKLTTYTKNLAKHYLQIPDSKIADTKCGYGCSDHASWHKKSYPAVTPFEGAMDEMNHRLHTSRDSMRYADIDHAFRFVQLGMAFIAETADPK